MILQVAAQRCSGYHGSATGARQRELKVVNGKVVVEIETMELLLKLLNNDRLRSPINGELFDSAAKKTVAKKGAGS